MRFLTKKGPSGVAGKDYSALRGKGDCLFVFPPQAAVVCWSFHTTSKGKIIMFENQAALSIALSLLTENDRVNKSQYFERLISLYAETEKALASGDPVAFFSLPPMNINDDFIKDI
ncbi:hypothetical protein KO48_003420 [Salmonella enterica subsp. enterica serovar Bredeney]|nr:hypothetical protein [Salmonella enterica subsp. enterica serovar Bredeney]